MKSIGISSCTTRRGFSLTELAIVLGIAGAILGSIWSVATAGWENSRQATLTTDVGLIVNNVRAYYGGQNGVSGIATVLTPKLAILSPPVIPGDMLRANGVGGCTAAMCADSPWGPRNAATSQTGSLSLCAWNPAAVACTANPEQFFAVSVISPPVSTCMRAVIANSGPGAPTGLYDVVIGTQSILALGGAFPVSASNALTYCNRNSTVSFVFRLATPSS